MFALALVQNQSEMAHYGYADARPLLRRLGYEAILFTADNIDQLAGSLARFDGLVLASNALNDKTIQSTFSEETFQKQLQKALDSGLGILSLHQLKLAQLEWRGLSFLGSHLANVSPVVRPKEERAASGAIYIPKQALAHTAILYPNPITSEKLETQALNFKSLPGIYWHYWEGIDLADWDTLVLDRSSKHSPRVLVACTRESSAHRVALSALTLDWQRQADLLKNLLVYVVEGRHNTAVLSAERRSSTAYDFLITTLQSKKFPFRQYFQGQELEKLTENLRNGIHQVLLMGPFVDRERLPVELENTINQLISDGKLNVLSIDPPTGNTGRVSISGRERFAARVLQDAEIKIQSELRSGNIDGSFWSTVETLQVLDVLPETSGNYAPLINTALKQADDHDRGGSYDEVFGVTCALFWLRARFRGLQAADTQNTRRWIESNIHAYDDREKALAYTTFAYLRNLDKPERDHLREILLSLSLPNLSEIDLITYLQASIAIDDLERVPDLVTALAEKQVDGRWVDLATSATAATALIEALDRLRSTGNLAYSELQQKVEKLIFLTVNHIQDEYQRSLPRLGATYYPWDGKASTSIKCLQAWLRFDRLLDLPVYEIADVLSRRHLQETAAASNRTALAVLEALKQENEALAQERQKLLAKESANSTLTAERPKMLFLVALSVYCILTLALGITQTSGIASLMAVVVQGFARNWPLHTAVTTIALTVAGLYFGYFRKREDSSDAT